MDDEKRSLSHQDDAPLLASDGNVARKSGEWTKRKLHFLRNYCGITATAMRKKWRVLYLDVMAGPGCCKITETGEEFPGSPLVALDYNFHDFIFIERDPDLANALQQRVAKHAKATLCKWSLAIGSKSLNAANSDSTIRRL